MTCRSQWTLQDYVHRKHQKCTSTYLYYSVKMFWENEKKCCEVRRRSNIDGFVKSQRISFFVIPANVRRADIEKRHRFLLLGFRHDQLTYDVSMTKCPESLIYIIFVYVIQRLVPGRNPHPGCAGGHTQAGANRRHRAVSP